MTVSVPSGNMTATNAVIGVNADGTASSGGGVWVAADATQTRPANATPTVVHGAVGAAANCLWTFTNFFDAAAQNSLLLAMKMTINLAGLAIPSGIAIRAHIYQTDQSAVDLSSNADAATFKTMIASAGVKFGYVDFSIWNIGGTGSDCIESYGVPVFSNSVVPIKAGAAARNLYAIEEATAVFTPINAGIMNLYGFRAGF